MSAGSDSRDSAPGGRADICSACATALRCPTPSRTLEDAVRRFVARKLCTDEITRRARRATERAQQVAPTLQRVRSGDDQGADTRCEWARRGGP